MMAGFVESLQGRAAATFVVLAGIGASLGSRRARMSADAAQRRRARRSLLRRGGFLLAVGLLFLPVWPADILHSYGVWLAVGSLLLFVSTRLLWMVAAGSVVAGALFVVQGKFFDHWNLTDLSYRDLWSSSGFVRNLMLDGWNPFFPWFGLYVFGMALGRQKLLDAAVRRRWLARVVPVALLAYWGSTTVDSRAALETMSPGILLSTAATPPTPAFVLFAGSLATIVIVAAIELAVRWPRLCRPLVSTGQLALTLYLGHVIVGLGTLESMGRLEGQSLPFAMASAVLFFAVAICFAVLWRTRFQRGPLEALMRKVAP